MVYVYSWLVFTYFNFLQVLSQAFLGGFVFRG